MAYRSLILQQFRSYTDYSVEFSSGVNIIVGPNGSGKTNLLEALYVLSTGSSFRTNDRDLVQHGKNWFRIEALWDAEQRILKYQLKDDGIEKQFRLDGVKKARLTHAHRVPVVLFEPDHLRLLKESPSARRDYLDTLLVKLQPDYSWLKHQLERVLLQRNNVLKRRLPRAVLDDQLFAWDIKFAELAEQVSERRRELIATINQQIGNVYSKIAHKDSRVEMSYESQISALSYRSGLLKRLSETIERDVERGFTTVGPQRDDFSLALNGAPAATAASRGELRSLLLALKIIELRLLAQQQDTTPLLLLDDVFSELDTSRRRALAELAKEYQTLITTTDADAILKHFLDGYKIIATG
ncbi:MAG: DNA replication/repair protein RecF [Candidatus Saccharimonadales bacterium]